MMHFLRYIKRFVLHKKKWLGFCLCSMLCMLVIYMLNALLVIEQPSTASYRYFVNTSYCRIPAFEPFDDYIRHIYKPQQPVQCAADELLIRPIYDADKRQYYLRFNEPAIDKYNELFSFLASASSLECTYEEVLFLRNDDKSRKGYVLHSSLHFNRDIPVSLYIDGLIVCCYVRTRRKYVSQIEAFPLIQYKEHSAYMQPKALKSHRSKPNVLLIGIDSLSQINFRRNMPKTFEYLRQHDWFELQGYNTIGFDYYSNTLALLTGFNWTNAPKNCMPAHVGDLEQCAFIWKTFKKLNYRTALADDSTSLSSWTFPQPGFQQKPTDYYLRPTLLAAEDKLLVKLRHLLAYCIGRKHKAEYVYDYALELLKRYANEPIFGLFWTSSFSRQAFDNSSAMDQRILEYFETFEQQQVFDNSIVMFLSNHGFTSAPLMNITQGFFEQRLPMFFISLPKWFHKEYPLYVEALKINRNRLTTPYDVHMTLKHILELFEPGVKLAPAKACQKCQSIFREVPEERCCEEAGITYNWCACF